MPRGPRRNFRPLPVRIAAAELVHVERELADRLAGVEHEEHAGVAAQAADLGGRVHQPALGGDVHERHHGGVVRGQRPLEGLEVDLAVLVVLDEHELAARAALELEQRDGVGAVLGPADQHAVLRFDRQRVHGHVPGPAGRVDEGDLAGRGADAARPARRRCARAPAAASAAAS